MELLTEKGEEGKGTKGTVELDEAFFGEVVDEMANDAERLQKVATRFGQVGSLPRLETQDLASYKIF